MPMSKLSSILSGWSNYLFRDEGIESLARGRARVCSECRHVKNMRFEVIAENRLKEIEGLCCELCLCPLSTKLRSPEETCPKEKW